MKPTFLDHLTEVSVNDLMQLSKKTADSPIPRDLLAWLYNEGYRLVDTEKFPMDNARGYNVNVGEGAFASVFIKNDNDKFILKVARKPDPCWVDFVKYARASRSPHVPRVPSLKQWQHKGDEQPEDWKREGQEGPYFLAMVERLHPLKTNYDKIKKEDVNILAYLYQRAWSMQKDLEGLIPQLAGKQMLKPDIARMADEFELSDHPFMKVMNDLNNVLSVDDCDIDLHGWNVMIRLPEQQLVITDPTSSKNYL